MHKTLSVAAGFATLLLAGSAFAACSSSNFTFNYHTAAVSASSGTTTDSNGNSFTYSIPAIPQGSDVASTTITLTPVSCSTPTYVRGSTPANGSSSATAITLDMGAGVASGNTLICGAAGRATSFTITDNQGDTWPSALESLGSDGILAVFALTNITTGPHTFTATMTGAFGNTYPQMWCTEYSNVSAIDHHVSHPQASPVTAAVDAVTSTSTTTTVPSVAVGITMINNNSVVVSAGTGEALRDSHSASTNWPIFSEDKAAAAGATTSTFTPNASTGPWQTVELTMH